MNIETEPDLSGDVVEYIISAGEVDKEQFINRIERTLSENREKEMATLAEQFIQEGVEKGLLQGRAEGIQKGIQKGKKEGKLDVALKLLKEMCDYRFVEKVTGLSEQELKKYELELSNQ